MEIYSLAAIPAGYLLGSFPGAYIVGRFWGKIDLLKEGDGHVSATAIYRHMGMFPFIVVLIIDIVKCLLAVLLAEWITDIQIIVLASGFAAVAGHCWSVFIKFMGGLGATAIYGVLAGLNFWATLIAFIASVIFLVITRKSSLATLLFIIIATVLLYFVFHETLLISLFPFSLLLLQVLKRIQTRNKGGDNYHNEIYDDLKRVK